MADTKSSDKPTVELEVTDERVEYMQQATGLDKWAMFGLAVAAILFVAAVIGVVAGQVVVFLTDNTVAGWAVGGLVAVAFIAKNMSFQASRPKGHVGLDEM